MALQAAFFHGEPQMIDYTPSADIAAGEVKVIGNVPAIAHIPIANGVPGAVAIGGGIYNCLAQSGPTSAPCEGLLGRHQQSRHHHGHGEPRLRVHLAAITKATIGPVFHRPDGVAAT